MERLKGVGETDLVLGWFGCWLWEGGLEISDGILRVKGSTVVQDLDRWRR